MKRRNFFGCVGLAAIPAIPAIVNSQQPTPSRILVRPGIGAVVVELEGKILPPVQPDRRTRGGTLCPANAQKIAAKIEEIFLGQKIAIAKSKVYGVDIETDAEMVAEWVGGGKELVKVSLKDDYTTLCFTCGDCVYVFGSRAKNPHTRNDFKDAYLHFDGDKLTVQERAPSGNLCVYVFRIQHEGPDPA